MIRMLEGKNPDTTFDQALHTCKAKCEDVLVVNGKGAVTMIFTAPSGQFSEVKVPPFMVPLGLMMADTVVNKGLFNASTKRQQSSNRAAAKLYDTWEKQGGRYDRKH